MGSPRVRGTVPTSWHKPVLFHRRARTGKGRESWKNPPKSCRHKIGYRAVHAPKGLVASVGDFDGDIDAPSQRLKNVRPTSRRVYCGTTDRTFQAAPIDDATASLNCLEHLVDRGHKGAQNGRKAPGTATAARRFLGRGRYRRQGDGQSSASSGVAALKISKLSAVDPAP